MEFRSVDGNEFSRLLPPEQLSLLPQELEISAEGDERRALAQRFDLLDLASLSAVLTLRPGPGRGAVLVQGRLEARVTQACVVTLAPVESRVSERFEAAFSAEPIDESEEEELLDGEGELPEPLPPEGLDLGELVAQQLAIALDPYPRAGDADSALQEIVGREEELHRRSPFEVLRSMKARD